MIKLDQSYSLGLFQDILESLFGDKGNIFDTSRLVNHKGYWKYITRMDRIGEQSDLEVHFYVVEHRGLSDPRVSLTKEIFRTLSEAGHRRALVAIYHPDSSTWRLSLVTMTLDIDNHGKLTREYSNARRYSFLLGENEKTRTPSDSLLKKGKVTDLSDLISRFSVEVVRQEFFDDYIDLFIRLYIAVSNDEKFSTVLRDTGVDRVKFTKNLLGKIVFIYFIQKKGWLGLSRDESWGCGDMNFMRSLWNRFHSGDTFVRPSTSNFYNDYLEHLFYNGFNKDRREDDAYDPITRMRIPYLNGGLFKEDYKSWADFDANVSNDIFSNGKDGILDIFDLYNFTIDEDDLYDSEVAVDPEMLGKIFEKMISVSSDNILAIVEIYKKKGKIQIGNELNKKFGAFYTPREIVHYMTRESLVAYLSNGLKGLREEAEIKVRTLISAKDRHLSKSGDIDNVSELDMLISIAEEVDILLQKVKILDPAVGSGAFPMGILHEIATLRYYLHSEGFCATHQHSDDEQNEDLTSEGHISMYRIKRDTIKNSIYGVDIEPGAIDIARLRFWLSLVVDAELPEPLPNFEFKFVSANTIIPLHDENLGEQTQLAIDDTLSLKTVRKYMLEYYNTDKKKLKEDIIQKIDSYVSKKYNLKDFSQLTLDGAFTPRQKQILSFRPFDSNYSNPFFDPSLMMGEGRGFDIVIGNPPYIGYKGNSDLFSVVKNTNLGIRYSHKEMDYWYYFAHLGLDLLTKKGFLTFITTNYWKTAFGAKILRETVKNNSLRCFLDFGEKKIFENATGQHNCIFMVGKSSNDGVTILKDNSKDLESIFNSDNLSKYRDGFFDENGCLFFNSEDFSKILNKIKTGKKLGVICTLGSGIKTGSDKISNEHILKYNLDIQKGTGIYVLNKDEADNLLQAGLSKVYLGDFYKNSDIGKYTLSKPKYYLLLALDQGDLENKIIYNHLSKFREILLNRKAHFGKLLGRLDLNFNRRDINLYTDLEKLVVPYRGAFNKFTYFKGELYSAEDIYFISKPELGIDLRFILSILNSTLYNFFLKFSSKVKGDIREYTTGVLKNIPIKIPSDQKPFIDLVNQLYALKEIHPDNDTSKLEREIDILVYNLYNLTPKEISIVEANS